MPYGIQRKCFYPGGEERCRWSKTCCHILDAQCTWSRDMFLSEAHNLPAHTRGYEVQVWLLIWNRNVYCSKLRVYKTSRHPCKRVNTVLALVQRLILVYFAMLQLQAYSKFQNLSYEFQINITFCQRTVRDRAIL